MTTFPAVPFSTATALGAYVISSHTYIYWHGVLFETRRVALEGLWRWLTTGWIMAPRASTSAGVEVWRQVG